MRLFTAVLARNEADKHLRKVLGRCLEFSDDVLLLDDKSTDGTPDIAKEMGCIVRTREERLPEAWGNESSAREELWNFATEHATEPDDWVLYCDSDMILQGDPRPLCESEDVNTWNFILYDLWSETEYREDGFWQGHNVPRPWLVAPNRVPRGWVPGWNKRGLHTGHLPLNWPAYSANAPSLSYYYLHLAYSSLALRAEKHRRYLSKAHLLTPFEKAHAESILDFDKAPGPP